MYRQTFGDDLLRTLSILFIAYMVLSALLGLPGGDVLRGFFESLRTLFFR